MVKRILIWMVVGLAIGNAIASWLGIRLLNYWFKPPGITDQDRCIPQISAAMTDLVHVQLIGMAAGLALFLLLGIFWYRRPAEAKPAATPAAPAR